MASEPNLSLHEDALAFLLGQGDDSTGRFKIALPKDENAELQTEAYWTKREPFRIGGVWNLPSMRPRQQIFERIVAPRVYGQGGGSVSVLLYGPPGTGKSSMAEDIAHALGWPLVSISPSDFIQRGGELVEARAKALFDGFMQLTDTVVLLDEIDQLILDRDSRGYNDHQDIFKLMTPGMLPKLKDLRERGSDGRSVFVIGTNYVERIDPAAKRAGRIDLRLLVLPPDSASRANIVRGLLADERPDWRGKNRRTQPGNIAQETPMFSYTELKGICSATEFDIGEPQIRFDGYDDRLDGKEAAEQEAKKRAFPQRPIDEYLALAKIWRETRRPLPEAVRVTLESLTDLSDTLQACLEDLLS